MKNIITLSIILLVLCNCGEEAPEIVEELDTFALDFSITHPPFGAKDLHPGFEFEWTKSATALSYELNIGKTFDASDEIFTDITTTSFFVDNIRYDQTYYWNVVGINSSGERVATSTVSFDTKKNSFVMDADFIVPQLSRSTSIHIYLPPDYNNGLKQYPVLYMFDGQFIFEQVSPNIPEWSVDENLDIVFQETGEGLIIVGIGSHYNHMGQRCDEYSPWQSVSQVDGQCRNVAGQLGGEGDEYMKFIVETLKPHIDAKYRTFSDKANTGILGAHLGGVMALYAGLEYPEIFSKIGIFSPAFWYVEDKIYDLATNKVDQLDSHNIYLLYGAKPNEQFNLADDVQRMHDILMVNERINVTASGYPGENCELGFRFCGRDWGKQFKEAYEWLFQI